MSRINRRGFIAGTAGVAGALAMPGTLFAQSEGQVIVGTWGGTFGQTLRDSVDVPIMKPMGIEVLQDISAPAARRTKLIAERSNRRGSMDVATLQDFDIFAAAQLGALEEINADNVPNMANVNSIFPRSHSIPHIFSAHVILYNTERVETPPQYFEDLWDPKWRDKIGISDNLYTTMTAVSAIVGGGSMTDFAPARQKMLELKELGFKVLPSTDATGQALKSEDIWLTINTVARGYSWRQSGIPLAHVVPREGAFPTLYEAAVPRNARNKENGLRYVNAMLDAGPQAAFAAEMGYLPTVTNAELDPDIRTQIDLTEEERARLWEVDYKYIAEQLSGMLDFWTRDFKG